MNTPKSSKKSIIIILIIAAIAAIVYFYYYGGASSQSGLLEANITPEGQAVGAKVLSLLNQINSLNIDPSLFSDPAYKTLKDRTIPIPEQSVGRANPFAPLPGIPLKNVGTAKN